jgi:putative hydrolase of the HAD superfamily
MQKYKHLFFDLDHTLWDYASNSAEALTEMFTTLNLSEIFKTPDDLVKTFTRYNDWVWSEYKNDRMTKTALRTSRFELTLEDFGVNDPAFAAHMNDIFLSIMPGKTNLISGAWELMEYLESKNYRMYIVTNGFTKIQVQKLSTSKLERFFTKMFSSEQIGHNKPKPQIFEWALKSANARKAESLMIGDELFADIGGARKFGIDQIYYNPLALPHTEAVTYEVRSLLEIKNIL